MRGRRVRSATSRRVQRSKQTTFVIKKKRGRRGPERTTIYEEYYEEEW